MGSAILQWWHVFTLYTVCGYEHKGQYPVKKKFSCELTALCCHPFRDLDEDPGVADNHDDQRQQEEAREREHVVGCLLPVGDKTPPRGALSKICWVGNGHVVENKNLRRKEAKLLLE